MGRRVRREGGGEHSSPPSAQTTAVLSLLDEEEVRERGLDPDTLCRVHWRPGGEEDQGDVIPGRGEADSGTISDPGPTAPAAAVTTCYYYYCQPVAAPVKRSRPSLPPAVAKLTAQLNEAKDRLRRLRLLEGQSNDQQENLDELIEKWRGVAEVVLEQLMARTGASRRAILRSVGVDWTAKAFDWLTAGDDDFGPAVRGQGRSRESEEDGHGDEHEDDDHDDAEGDEDGQDEGDHAQETNKERGFRRVVEGREDLEYDRVDD